MRNAGERSLATRSPIRCEAALRPASNIVDVYISYLRQKIDDRRSAPLSNRPRHRVPALRRSAEIAASDGGCQATGGMPVFTVGFSSSLATIPAHALGRRPTAINRRPSRVRDESLNESLNDSLTRSLSRSSPPDSRMPMAPVLACPRRRRALLLRSWVRSRSWAVPRTWVDRSPP